MEGKEEKKYSLTVFVTVYNIAPYLPRFFECMARQSYADYLLLIVDDGSEDESLTICRERANLDERIRVISRPHEGISAVRNYVLSILDTPFAASADGDDVYEKDYLLHLAQAQEKYNADLVIDRVIHRDEKYNIMFEMPELGERVYTDASFPTVLPVLLENGRLDYLYGKLYKTEFLKNIRVENDVKMGSDTMINSQYVTKIHSIALIDDPDVNYIHYTSRSVTPSMGTLYFERYANVDVTIAKTLSETGFLTPKMQRTIDGRTLKAACTALNRIAVMDASIQQKYQYAEQVILSPAYMEAYNRQKALGNLSSFSFQVIHPGSEKEYVSRRLKGHSINNKTAVRAQGISIRYLTGDFKDIGLKEYVVRRLTGNYHVREFWADKDVTFSLHQGDMLGIVGSNGAGKSTLLKVISGIMAPTKGWVHAEGKIAALLELTSGFDPDLTVRENTFLRGALLGYTRKFMNEKYDEIIAFAELQDFQERPFKQLSSGMKSRLAFSIACLVEPDILILDEVLAVGDGAFRKKSEAKMREILASGVTGILVSHSIGQVRALCNKILWLDHGKQICFSEDVRMACNAYEEFLATKMLPEGQDGVHELSLAYEERMAAQKREQEKDEKEKLLETLMKATPMASISAAQEFLKRNGIG